MAYELKTKVNDASVNEFFDKVENDQRREDCYRVLDIMREVTGCEPKMWGKAIIGFDLYTYKYASGHSGEWMATGFSPRKQNLTIYIMSGFVDHPELMDKLGKFKVSKSCLYVKKLEDVDEKVLRKLIKRSVEYVKKGKVNY